MATTAAPYGFRPIGLLGARPFTQGFRQIKIASGYATNIFFGDAVLLVNTGTVAKDTGTATMTPLGIFLGVSFTDPNYGPTFRQYWPASTVVADALAYVCDDPDALFQIQADGSLAQTALGNNAGIINTAGSTVTGNSAVALDSAVATTNTLPLRIVDFVRGPTSDIGDDYTDVIVKWNFGMHLYNRALGI